MKQTWGGAAWLLLPALLLISCLAAAEIVDRIVAVVGNEVITDRELSTAYNTDALGLMRPDPITGEPARKLTREDYLNEMIERRVIGQEVKKQGIKVDALEVEKAIDRKRESLGLSEEDFTKALAMQGISMDMYRDEVRDQLITYRLISQEVRGEVEVTDEEIKAYYAQHPEMFMEKDKVHLLHIFIPFAAEGPEAEQTAVAKVEDIRKQIEQGADFADMARQFSKSPTASMGGDLGWFTIGELLPEFRNQVKDLAVGRMSPVFVHGNGAHLIKLDKIEKGGPIPFDQLKEQIHEIIYQQEAMERYDLWLERLKARTHIENRLNGEPSPYPNP